MSSALITPTSRPGALSRLFSPVTAAYLRWRLKDAETQVEGLKRELANRERELTEHRKHCEQFRVRLSQLGAL